MAKSLAFYVKFGLHRPLIQFAKALTVATLTQSIERF